MSKGKAENRVGAMMGKLRTSTGAAMVAEAFRRRLVET